MNTFIRNPNFREPKSPSIKIKIPLNTYNIIVAQQSLPPNKNQYFFPYVDVSQKFEETLQKCRKTQKKKMRINAIEKVTISKNLSDNIIQNYRKVEENSKQNMAPRDRCLSESMKETNDSQKNRRASELVDQLLLDIYGRANFECHIGKHFETEYCSSTSFKSFHDKFDEKLQYSRLETKDKTELHFLIGALKERVTYSGNLLVKQLKKKDALKSKQEKICNFITAHLHAYSDKRSEDTNMRFSPNPTPGDSGFNQWRDAMKMVAKLPGGIPPEFRKKLWKALAEKHLQSRGVNWAQTEKLCFNEWSNPDDSELGIQIVKDLHRTGCSLFCGAAGQENQALLKRVLLAYARWNKSVGYCQGFNMLAALILQVMDKNETDSVKVMIYLIEGVLPESYFANNLRGLSVDMIVFRDLLKIRLPHLSKHLEALQNDAREGNSYEPPLTNVFTMQWFLTLFCNCLPQTTVLRVWDLIFLEGNEILLRTAIAIWEKLSDRILAVNSADEFYSIMGVLTREMLEFGLVDSNTLVKSIVAIGTCNELNDMRDKYLYNITPWTQSVQTAAKKGFKLFYSDDDDTESDFDEKAAVTAAYGISIGRKRAGKGVVICPKISSVKSNDTELHLSYICSVSHLTKPLNTKDGAVIQPYAHGHPDRERLALDISALKKQYAKLRERQRQAHIILQAACARQPMGSNSSPAPIAMNHLLLGKNAIVNSRGRRLGPPKGSIPPARAPRIKEVVKKKNSAPETIHWKDTEKFRRRQSFAEESESSETYVPDSDSSSYSEDDASSTSTELCDEPGRLSDFDSDDKPDLDAKQTSDSLPVDLKAREVQSDIQELISDINTVPVRNLIDLNSDLDQKVKNTSPKEEKLKRHKSYEETATNYPEKSVLCKQKSFDVNNLPVIETSLWTPYQIKEESPEEPPKQSSIDLLQVEDKRLESGRRNSERALKIIQENSLILHRILQQQKSSEKEDSEDEISKTFMRSESLLSKDERTDEERSSKDGDEELESGVESFSVSPALFEEESDKSLKKDLEDEETLTILGNNYYVEDVSSCTNDKLNEKHIKDTKFGEESEENLTKLQLDTEETCQNNDNLNPETIPTKDYQFSYKFKEESEENIKKTQLDIEETCQNNAKLNPESIPTEDYQFSYKYKEESEENITKTQLVNEEKKFGYKYDQENEENLTRKQLHKEETTSNEDINTLEETIPEKYNFTYRYKEDSEENLPSRQLDTKETSQNEDNINLDQTNIEEYKFSYKYKEGSEESLPKTQLGNEELPQNKDNINIEEINVEEYKFSYKYKEDSEENVTKTQLDKETTCQNTIEANKEEILSEEYKFSYKFREETEENLAGTQLDKEKTCQNPVDTKLIETPIEEYKFSYKYKEESEESLAATKLEKEKTCQNTVDTKLEETPVKDYKFSYKYKEESEESLTKTQLEKEETCGNNIETKPEETSIEEYKFSYKYKEESEENLAATQLNKEKTWQNTIETKLEETPVKDYKFSYKFREDSEENIQKPHQDKEETSQNTFMEDTNKTGYKFSYKFKENSEENMTKLQLDPEKSSHNDNNTEKYTFTYKYKEESEDNLTKPNLKKEEINQAAEHNNLLSFLGEATTNMFPNVASGSPKKKEDQNEDLLSFLDEPTNDISSKSPKNTKPDELISFLSETDTNASSSRSLSPKPSSGSSNTKNEEFISFFSEANTNRLQNQGDNKFSGEDQQLRSSSRSSMSPKLSLKQRDTKDKEFISFFSEANISIQQNQENISINKLSNEDQQQRSSSRSSMSPKPSLKQRDTKDEEFISFFSEANISIQQNEEDISINKLSNEDQQQRSSSRSSMSPKPSLKQRDTKDEEFISFFSEANISIQQNEEDISINKLSNEDQKQRSSSRSSMSPKPSLKQRDTKDEEFISFFSETDKSIQQNQEDISINKLSNEDQKQRSSSRSSMSPQPSSDPKKEEFISFFSEVNITSQQNEEDISINKLSNEDQKQRSSSRSSISPQPSLEPKTEEFISFFSETNINRLKKQEDAINISSNERFGAPKSPKKYKYTESSPDSKPFSSISADLQRSSNISCKYNLDSPVSSKVINKPDNNPTFARQNLSINLSPDYSQPKFGDTSPEAPSCLNFTKFETEIPCTSKSIQFSPICTKDKSPDSPPKYLFNLPTLSPPRRALKSPLSPKETFNPFPVKPATRQPKELGIKLGMYKDLSPLKSPNK